MSSSGFKGPVGALVEEGEEDFDLSRAATAVSWAVTPAFFSVVGATSAFFVLGVKRKPNLRQR